MQNQVSGLGTGGRAGFKDMLRAHEGGVAMIFAFMIVPLIGMVGLSVDLGRSVLARTQMQAALDGAALAAARSWQVEQNLAKATATAEQHWNSMKPTSVQASNLAFSMNGPQNEITLTGTASISSPFLSLAGWNPVSVGATSSAMISVTDTSIELSLMLDVTGSMGGQKIVDLRAAAKDLVDIVVWANQSTYTSKIAMAPFSTRVNVGNLAATVTGLPATDGDGDQLRHCVTERTGAQAFTDAAPGAGAYVGRYIGGNYSSDGSCSGSSPSDAEQILPLTNDKATLKTHIEALSTSGGTAGHIGTAWAWYLLSPKWSALFPAASQPAAYGTPKLRKVALLMTDGEYNTSYSFGQGNATDQARQLCTNMKAEGIEVITVGFDIGLSGTAVDTLRHCASAEANFYNATSGEDLKQAFRDIAFRMSKLRLSN